MKNLLTRALVAAKAARELGAAQTFWYALYQFGLRTGHYRRSSPLAEYEPWTGPVRPLFHRPDRTALLNLLGEHAREVTEEADEICAGQVRLFGGPPVPLNMAPPGPRKHWTALEGNLTAWGVEDIKFVWEPARFGWAYTLGRAYVLTGEEKYSAAFWQHFEAFLAANPPNMGPNWSSGQEVALRMLALLFARTAFEGSAESTPERLVTLAGAVNAHARRIPPTLVYARAQNNNHLVSEALGLYAAGSVLESHPEARRWCETGRKMLNHALQSQIEPDGTYAQHSMNYHRLMLHAALQAALVGQPFTPDVQKRLAAAALWLLAQVDPNSGRAPNLGSNDGALILPLAAGEFGDHRPTAQAAARAFLGKPALPPGPWDELGLWLGQDIRMHAESLPKAMPESPAVHRLGNSESWGTLRAVHFKSRPSHADQLHVDLWWRGENIALDAGTFRYTAPAPWDNALSHTSLHNTVEINGLNQMTRAGRFLWLDWAQAGQVSDESDLTRKITARHNGYERMGVSHQRTLQWDGANGWRVEDILLPTPRHANSSMDKIFTARLHWLLPDWLWELNGSTITLTHPSGGRFSLALSAAVTQHINTNVESVSLHRAGDVLAGSGNPLPVQGWYSPTYNVKLPALSFSLTVKGSLPMRLFSEWRLGV